MPEWFTPLIGEWRTVRLEFYVGTFLFFNGLIAVAGFVVMRDLRRIGPNAIRLPKRFHPLLPVSSTVLQFFCTLFLWLAMLETHHKVPIATAVLIFAFFTIGLTTMVTNTLLFFSRQLNTRIGKIWVKSLDFGYLACAFIGLVRVVNASPFATNSVSALDSAALLFVALALAIRLSKAIIEVFFDDWVGSPEAKGQPAVDCTPPPQPRKRRRERRRGRE
jgi:hypothetical protein